MDIGYKSIALDYSTEGTLRKRIQDIGFPSISIECDYRRGITWVKNLRIGTDIKPITKILDKVEADTFKRLDWRT